MAQITTLKDKDGKTIYPMTSSSAVFDRNGICLDNRLARIVEKEQGKGLSSADFTSEEKQKLSTLPTSAELTKQLSAKQAALQSSDDIQVTGAKLSLTEQAKLQWFVNRWNQLAGDDGHAEIIDGKFQASLNGIEGIELEEAMTIYTVSASVCEGTRLYLDMRFYKGRGYRTNFKIKSGPPDNPLSTYRLCHGNQDLEVFSAEGLYMGYNGTTINTYRAFANCPKLRIITKLMYCVDNQSFLATPNLEYVGIFGLRNNIDFRDNPKLNLATFTYAIKQRAELTTAIVITVHPDVYAKLTGDTTNAAAAALSPEEAEKWQALVPSAIDKNITFATA